MYSLSIAKASLVINFEVLILSVVQKRDVITTWRMKTFRKCAEEFIVTHCTKLLIRISMMQYIHTNLFVALHKDSKRGVRKKNVGLCHFAQGCDTSQVTLLTIL